MDTTQDSQPEDSVAPLTTTHPRGSTSTRGGPLNSPSTRHLLQQKSSEDDDHKPSHELVKSSSRSQIDEEKVIDNGVRSATLAKPLTNRRGRRVVITVVLLSFVAIIIGVIAILVFFTVNKLDNDSEDFFANSSSWTANMSSNSNRLLESYQEEEERYCISSPCISVAARLFENIDTSIDPCDNFWEYACGGWLARTEIPPTLDAWGAEDEISMKVRMKVKMILESSIDRTGTESAERKFKTFYRNCMDTESMERQGVTPFLNILEEFGGWALFSDWNVDKKSGLWTVQRALEILHFSYDIDAFFSHVIAKDDTDSSVNIIQFDQGGLTLGDRSDYLGDEKTSPLIVDYKKYLSTIAKLFNASKSESDLFAESVFKIEKQLAQIHEDENSERRQSPKDMYNKMTVNDLRSVSPRIDWHSYLSGMYEAIEGDTEILVTNPYYLGNISKLIGTSSDSDLNNYFVWQLLHKFAAPLLTNDISEAYISFKKVMRNIPSSCEKSEDRRQTHIRQSFCQKRTNEWFGNAVAAKFIQGNGTAVEMDVRNMITNIKEIFKETLKTCWMDKPTEQAALDKLESLSSRIGYPKFILNETILDEYYEGFEVNGELSFFDNILNALKHQRSLRKRAFDTNDQSEDWSMNPTEVNAFYSFSENVIGFTAGLLQPPYYDIEYPKYVSYATLGSAIAHEITHAFDRAGALYDKDGNLRQWWTDESWDNFIERTYCLDNFYQTLRMKGVEEEIDNSVSLNENIADIGGLKHAYQAYKNWRDSSGVKENMLPIPGINLTNDKIFFISFAQNWCKSRRTESISNFVRRSEHALEEFRVIGSVSQNEDFQKAFECATGSKMSPSHRCVIW